MAITSIAVFVCLFAWLGAASDVLEMDEAAFKSHVRDNQEPWFVDFFAPWCGHCKILYPIYEELGTRMKDTIGVARVDCTIERQLCWDHRIMGYPTLKFFRGNVEKTFRGNRDLEHMESYLHEMLQRYPGSKKQSNDEPAAAAVAATVSSGSEGADVQLVYYSHRGLAEPIRLTLEAAGVKYSQQLVSTEEFQRLAAANPDSFPFSQLPVLRLKGKSHSHMGAILRVLGREYNMYGTTSEQNALVDGVVEAMEDMRRAYMMLVMDKQFQSKVRTYLDTTVPPFLREVETILSKSRASGQAYLTGATLTIADLVTFDTVLLHIGLEAGVLTEFPMLGQFVVSMAHQQQLREYLLSDRRPGHPNPAVPHAFYGNEQFPARSVDNPARAGENTDRSHNEKAQGSDTSLVDKLRLLFGF